MPKGMIYGMVGATLGILVILGVLEGILTESNIKKYVMIGVLVLEIIMIVVTLWMYLMYRAFSYNGKRQMSRKIIEGIAEYISMPEGGCGLDVGCGSGALAIACAKNNPKAMMKGIDRWGKDYASFTKDLCESNAKAEGVNNIDFQHGDATGLGFDDETFDAVTSNYVYHNIVGYDKQQLLMETLRTLKKGGTFAIHDIMSKGRYGDMDAFIQKLKDMGYEKVELIDTTDGLFMSKWEAGWMMLSGSKILVGRK